MNNLINILHLEDDAEDIELINTILNSSELFCKLRVVKTRNDFEQAVNNSYFDIILADFRLPMYDGISALRYAKEKCPDIPFIFVSGTLGEDAAIEALTEGGTDYVPKQKLVRLVPAILRALLEAENKRERKLAAEALRKSQEQLELINNSIDDVIYSVNGQTGEFEYISPAFERKFGYSITDIMEYGGRWPFLLKVIHKENASISDPIIELQNSNIKTVPVWEHWWQCKDGSYLFMEDRSVPVCEGGSLLRINGVLRDITERKIAQEKLIESEERYRTVTQTAVDAIITTDYNGKILDWNTGAEKIFGYKAQEITGKELKTIMPEAYIGSYIKALESLKEKGESKVLDKTIEMHGLHKNGITFPVEISLALWETSSGKYFTGIIRDITERKHTEEVLRESEEQFRTLAEQSPNMIFINSKAKIVYANQKCVDVMGYTKEEYYDSKFNFLDLIVPQHQNFIKDNFDKHLNGEDLQPYEYSLNTKDGKRIDVIISSKLIYYKGEKAILGIVTDLTELKHKEKALRKSEERYRNLIENQGEGIAIVDSKEYFTFVNPAGERIFGVKPGGLINRNLAEFVDNEQMKLITSETQKRSYGERSTYEFQIKHLNGEKHILLVTATPQFEDDGCFKGTFGVFLDITERKRVETELRHLTHAIEQSPVSVIITNTSGEIEYVNPKFTESTGYTENEVLGKNPRILKSGELPMATYKQLWDQILSGKEWHGEFHNRKKNGDLFWEAASISPIRDEKNNITHFVAIKEDITERKRIDKALKESEEHYRVLVNTVPDIIVRTDLLGNIVYVNENVFSSLTEGESILGKNIISFVSQDDKERAVSNFKLMFEKNLGPREYKIRITDTLIDCEINGDILKDSDGNPEGMVYVLRDITFRKKAEKELEIYRLHLEELIKERTNELEEVNKLLQEEIIKQKEAEKIVKLSLEKEKEFSELKSKFISIASHEFRTPLTIIFSSTELLQRYGRKWDENKYNEQIERVKFNVQYMTEIMDDVLTISRTETGKIVFEPRSADLLSLCTTILEDLKLLLSKKHNLMFKFKLKKNHFIFDEKLLKFVLINLLSNSIKYSVNGGKIDFVVDSEEKDLIFEISDEGIGIPEKDQQFLFEPFHRGLNVGEIQGTGLGMSIIKRSVDMHNGIIEFSSKENVGTKFVIKIPLCE
jgi:PAS domain S-box-containing protein